MNPNAVEKAVAHALLEEMNGRSNGPADGLTAEQFYDDDRAFTTPLDVALRRFVESVDKKFCIKKS